MQADFLVRQLLARGVTLFSGTPCSYLGPLIDAASQAPAARYLPASSEGEALSIVSGAWLAGRGGAVLCQNSGLGNMVNPLTSLNLPFRIPVLMLISLRGDPPDTDEPQHRVMGRITRELLELIGVGWHDIPQDAQALDGVLDAAFEQMRASGRPHALLVRKATSPRGSAVAATVPADGIHVREEVIRATVEAIPSNAVLVATTGKTGRELYLVGDRPLNFYCVGSMGYANAVAHGIALGDARPVYVLDGDGAALMHLGNLATIGAAGAASLVHVILDNGTYDSTGGQPTCSQMVDFARLGAAVGYRRTTTCSTLAAYRDALATCAGPGPSLIHMKIRPSSMADLGRPSEPPDALSRRLRGALLEDR